MTIATTTAPKRARKPRACARRIIAEAAPPDRERPSERIFRRLLTLCTSEGIEVREWTGRLGGESWGGCGDLPREFADLRADPDMTAAMKARVLASSIAYLRGAESRGKDYKMGDRDNRADRFADALLANLYAAEALALQVD